MPECTCRGGNPNCFKCGGWGWIGDAIGEHRKPDSGPLSHGNTLKGERRKGISKKAARNIPCPYCTKKVANLDHHVSVSHPDEWLHYAEKGEIKDRLLSNNLNRCTECGALVRRIDKHLVKAHGIESNNT